jgi:hypothetical protein
MIGSQMAQQAISMFPHVYPTTWYVALPEADPVLISSNRELPIRMPPALSARLCASALSFPFSRASALIIAKSSPAS